MASKSDSDWASLPENVLDSILGRLAPMDDCIRFSAVCSKWRRVACENFRDSLHHLIDRRRRRHQLPLLMVPSPDNSTDTRSLYDVRRKRLYDFQLKVPYNRCAGSSNGWLIFVDDSFQVTLFNPFSGKSIHLPPIRRLFYEKRRRDEDNEISALSHLEKYEYEKKLREEYDEEEKEYVPDIDELEIYDDSENEDEIEQDTDHEHEEEEESTDPEYNHERFHESDYSVVRGVLSANPETNPNEYILLVIYGTQSRLAYIKSGDEYWTYIDDNICDFLKTTYNSPVRRGLWYWSDIIYRNGLFYVLDHLGVLLSCDVRTNLKVERITKRDELHSFWNHKTYLVESSEGDLLRVIRVIEDDYHYEMTKKFVVYKLVDFLGENPHWTEVNSLGNDALSLGDNHSISVVASDFVGCQPNSIYFCDDCTDFYHHGGPNDIGVFNFQDGCVRRHYTLSHSQRLMPPSIWISPSFL